MIRRALEKTSHYLAMIGGVALIAMALITMVSILGRVLLGRPIPGDIELAQLLTAFAISSFLPWCQVQKGHVVIDFFTAYLRQHLQDRLQRLGFFCLAIILGVLAWRTMRAVSSALETSETSMILSIPIWVQSLALVPGFLLAALVALAQATNQRNNGS